MYLMSHSVELGREAAVLIASCAWNFITHLSSYLGPEAKVGPTVRPRVGYIGNIEPLVVEKNVEGYCKSVGFSGSITRLVFGGNLGLKHHWRMETSLGLKNDLADSTSTLLVKR